MPKNPKGKIRKFKVGGSALIMDHYMGGWIIVKTSLYIENCEAELLKIRKYNKTSKFKIVPCTISYSLPLKNPLKN